MTLLRSLVFQLYLYGLTVGLVLLHVPAMFMDDRHMRRGFRLWGRAGTWGMERIAGIRLEVRGREHVARGGLLIASKHQSMLETMAYFGILHDPAIILKKELTLIPLVGPVVRKAGLIVVDRKGGGRAVLKMTRDAADRLDHGRDVLIFPEGHRMPVDGEPHYKRGIWTLYRETGRACVPAALNSGLFWPRRSLIRHPGTCVIEFLPPIPPGLEEAEFRSRLETATEQAVARLVAEARAETRKP